MKLSTILRVVGRYALDGLAMTGQCSVIGGPYLWRAPKPSGREQPDLDRDEQR
jgi:hypothetical protein